MSGVKSFENTERTGEIARNEQFLIFPQCFLFFSRTFHHFHQIWKCRLQSLSLQMRLKSVVWGRVNISPSNKAFKFSCRYMLSPAISDIITVIRTACVPIHFFWAKYVNLLPNDKILDPSMVMTFVNKYFKASQTLDFFLWLGRKYCGKGRKCWLPAFSPFPTMF